MSFYEVQVSGSPEELEYSDPMSQQQINDIFQRLRNLESAPANSPQNQKPEGQPAENWFKRNAYWFFPTVAVMITLLIGSGFVASYFGLVVDKRIDAKLEQPTKDARQVQLDLAKLSTKLDGFIDIVRPLIEQKLRGAATLPPKDFAARLPEVKEAIDLARNVSLSAPADVVGGIQSRLKDTSTDAPSYWQTAAAFVNLRSSPSFVNLPDCLDMPPIGLVSSIVGKTVTHGPLAYHECALQLDSPKAPGIFASSLNFADLECVRCVVSWRGGPIFVSPNKPPMTKFVFVECKFEMAIPQKAPDTPGRTLLTSLVQSENPSSLSVALNN